MKSIYFSTLAICLLLLYCEGKQGSRGPAGPPGPGTTRIIYTGSATSDSFVVNIQELQLNDFPSINCYYFLDGAWSELYLDYTTNSGTIYPYALIEEQQITLYMLDGLQYRIVLII